MLLSATGLFFWSHGRRKSTFWLKETSWHLMSVTVGSVGSRRPFCSSASDAEAGSGARDTLRAKKTQKRRHISASQVTVSAASITGSQRVPPDDVIHRDSESAFKAASVSAQVKDVAACRGQRHRQSKTNIFCQRRCGFPVCSVTR